MPESSSSSEELILRACIRAVLTAICRAHTRVIDLYYQYYYLVEAPAAILSDAIWKCCSLEVIQFGSDTVWKCQNLEVLQLESAPIAHVTRPQLGSAPIAHVTGP